MADCGRPNVKFGLHVHYVCEANVDALGKEKKCWQKECGQSATSPTGD